MSDESFSFSSDEELDEIIYNGSRESSQKFPHRIDYGALSEYWYPSNMEARLYQEKIIATALLDNTLVALPTGLGKTFIAATVMLNFHRWFPDSKIIFVAPTRPLVAQQIKACATITGIPAHEMDIMIERPKQQRVQLWEESRIFFSTPQVVDNDLRNGILDPKTIGLLVVDEAHRARGAYAYNNVAKFMALHNPQYRILALTATPASNIEGVQELVNNLGISKLEVRTEKSDDIVPYLRDKPIVRKSLDVSPEIDELMSLIADAAKPILEVVNQRQVLHINNPRWLSKMACMEASRKMHLDPNVSDGQRFASAHHLKILVIVGDAMTKLRTYGVKMFYPWFSEKVKEYKKSKGKVAREFFDHENVTEVLEKAKELTDDPSASGHPKTDATIAELEEFFATADPSSRVIIFTELRLSALELVTAIERRQIGAKPHIFIGQAGGKEEKEILEPGQKRTRRKDQVFDSGTDSSKDAQSRGMSQAVQKQIISQFKSGEYNVLVATSIGEEGLDIGEVDLIICYDSTSSPIKNIQRMGRTGRKRDGRVVLLFSGNEERKFNTAVASYEQIQTKLQQDSSAIDLNAQVRMVPKGFTPKVRKIYIDVPDENTTIQQEDDDDEIIRIASEYSNSKLKKKGNKRQKKEPKKFKYPDGMPQGFTSVMDMLNKRKKPPADPGPASTELTETAPARVAPGSATAESVSPPAGSALTSAEPAPASLGVVALDSDSDIEMEDTLSFLTSKPDTADMNQGVPSAPSGNGGAVSQDDDDDRPLVDRGQPRPSSSPVPPPATKNVTEEDEDDFPLYKTRVLSRHEGSGEGDDDVPLGRSRPTKSLAGSSTATSQTAPRAKPATLQRFESHLNALGVFDDLEVAATSTQVLPFSGSQAPQAPRGPPAVKPPPRTKRVEQPTLKPSPGFVVSATQKDDSAKPSLRRTFTADSDSEDMFDDGLDDMLLHFNAPKTEKVDVWAASNDAGLLTTDQRRQLHSYHPVGLEPTDPRTIDPMAGVHSHGSMGHSSTSSTLINISRSRRSN
ncbi:ATP-dependent DNA helicase Mph1p [Diutina catenulata]